MTEPTPLTPSQETYLGAIHDLAGSGPVQAKELAARVGVKVAVLDPQPLVRRVRCRTVANVDSMGLVVRRWIQCSAGKS